MKYLLTFLMPLFIICCNQITLKDSSIQKNIETTISYSIDTICIKEIEIKNICFVIEQSSYPQISGAIDEIFRKQINDIFIDNFNEFIRKAKLRMGGCPESDENNNEFLNSIPASARGDFEILTDSDTIISIVQYFSTLPCCGANGWELTSDVTNISLKNRSILINSDMNMDYKKEELINYRIKQFFDKEYPSEAEKNEIDYPFITNKKQFEHLKFGVRKDSTVLIIDAYPVTYHYNYTTYIIPIEEWRKK